MKKTSDIQAPGGVGKQDCQGPLPDVRKPWWVDIEQGQRRAEPGFSLAQGQGLDSAWTFAERSLRGWAGVCARVCTHVCVCVCM